MVEVTFAFSGLNNDIGPLTHTEVNSVLVGYEILHVLPALFSSVCVLWFSSAQRGFF